MDPRGGAGAGWMCLAVLCSGAALALAAEHQGGQSLEPPRGSPGPQGVPNGTAGDGDEPVAWTEAAPPGRAGNRSQSSSGVPVRYWSPIIFVAVALLVLFLTYSRTKGAESGSGAAPDSDFSELEDAAPVPLPDVAPRVELQEERAGPERPPEQRPSGTVPREPEP